MYQVRLPIPKRLQVYFHRIEIQRSLRTRDPIRAKKMALKAGSKFAELCDSLLAMSDMNEIDVASVIDRFFQSLLSTYVPPEPIHPNLYDRDLNEQSYAADALQVELSEMLVHRNYSDAIRREAAALLKPLGGSLEGVSKLQLGQLLEGVVRARREQINFVLFRQRSLLDPYVPDDGLFTDAYVNLAAHVAKPVHSLESMPKLALGSGGLVGDRVDQYLADAEGKPSTISEKRGVLNWFAEFVGPNTDVRAITPENMVDFRKVMMGLKANIPVDTPLSAAQTNSTSEGIHPKTAKKKFDTVKTFLRWLASMGAIQTVPGGMLNVKVPKTPKSKKRRPFTPSELDALFSSPMYTGCKSAAKRYLPGSLVLRDDLYWMPLVLVYTGMRIAEPLQIAARDVIVDNEFPYFDIDLAKIDLKQDVSDRYVPIHPDLVSFGFLNFVKKRQQVAPTQRLFRGITSNGPVGNYYSKNIGRYLDRVGLNDSRLVAHSFRHGFKDALRNAAVPEGEQHFIMGHSNSEAAHNYGTGSKIDVLWNWVAKLDLGLSDDIKARLRND